MNGRASAGDSADAVLHVHDRCGREQLVPHYGEYARFDRGSLCSDSLANTWSPVLARSATVLMGPLRLLPTAPAAAKQTVQEGARLGTGLETSDS